MTRSSKVLFLGIALAVICGFCGVLMLTNPLNIAAGIIACLTFLGGVMCFCTYHVLAASEDDPYVDPDYD
jgi:drug/metabolite transporter (DMT)-like permease